MSGPTYDETLARSLDLLLSAEADADRRAVASGHGLEPGAQVGRYTVRALLGRGGMGAVYRAHDSMMARDVALKVLNHGPGRGSVDRFRREVVALASVSHPNIVSVFDAGVHQGRPFVVLEFVDGHTLRGRIEAGPLSFEEAERIARDVLRGLEAAHAVGVVHRDLKPENVLLDAEGRAKIADFGLALLNEGADAAPMGETEAGVLLGTPQYMAPEQVRSEVADARADLFSFGAVLFELVTAQRAFDGASRGDVISAVLRDHPVGPPEVVAEPAGARLLHVAMACLEKDRALRPASTGQVVALLDTETVPVAKLRSGPYGPPPDVPETRYAQAASGVHIAYQVLSPAGTPTLFAAPPFISNLEVIWEAPHMAEALRELARMGHCIQYDKRGVGMSDPIAPECTTDERVEDMKTVLDAEGVERVTLLGFSEGGPISIAFAAKYPERVRGLFLLGSFARIVQGEDYPHGLAAADYTGLTEKWVARWGKPSTLTVPLFSASRRDDPDFVRWANRYERQCASPGTVRRLIRMQFEIDVRDLLPQVRCPVLVAHRRGDPAVSIDHGIYLAQNIPGARFVELEGIDHAPWEGDTGSILSLLRAFLAELEPA